MKIGRHDTLVDAGLEDEIYVSLIFKREKMEEKKMAKLHCILTSSHKLNVSAGNDTILSHAEEIPSIDPVLKTVGRIILKQSSRGKRRNNPLISARSSIDRMGPGLIKGPRRK
jgi:hypothetical protein